MLKIFNNVYPSTDVIPNASNLIIDGPALAQMMKPTHVKTFRGYTDNVKTYVTKKAKKFDRIDAVYDVYKHDSLKQTARELRGKGDKVKVTEDGPIPSNWQSFLRNDDNKTSLFALIADGLKNINPYTAEVYVTKENTVLSNVQTHVARLSPCNQEEADTRMLLHASTCVGHTIIKTVDTDVVVNAIALFSKLSIDELWIEMGTKQLTYFPVHHLVSSLGEDICKGLLFFHAFTGCDNVSTFYSIGKKTAWNVFITHLRKFASLFARLPYANELTDDDFNLIQLLVCLFFTKDESIKTVDECRLHLFQKGVSLDRLPPSSRCLYFHTLRAMLQSNTNAISLDVGATARDPCQWGWTKNINRVFVPFWADLPATTTLKEHLIKCGCKTKCSKSKRCSCKSKDLLCTSLCACDYELCNTTIRSD